MNSIKFFFVIIFSLIAYNSNAQGCSDAGFCTINSIKPNSNDTIVKKRSQIKVGASVGSADNSIIVFGNYLEYNLPISINFGIDAKITSLLQSGNGISNFGISDLYLIGNYSINEKIKLVFGSKIPLSSGNIKKNNIALPMDYQSSLGTYDIILGLGYEVKKIQFVFAFQSPLVQNKNEFQSVNYPLNSKLSEFQSTNNFKRSGDVLLRLSYPIRLNDKIRITPSLLPIYHLQNDRYTNTSNVEMEIQGSQGLTFNGNAYLDFDLNSKNALQLNLGMPFIVRDSRPDGLTRAIIVNLEYKIIF